MDNKDIDLSPETICGTVIDTQETLIRGETPNEDQIRACKLANASEAMLSALQKLLQAMKPEPVGSNLYNAGRDALALLDTLSKPR